MVIIVAHSGDREAAVLSIRARTRSGGGTVIAFFWTMGGRASFATFRGTQPHRSAVANAAEMMRCMCMMVAADKPLLRWEP